MGRTPRILVTRLRYLGDVILTTPLVQLLRAELPSARLDYLVEEAHAPALAGCPCLDEVHVLPDGASLGQSVALMRELRQRDYDWVLDLFGNPRSALICALSGARRRVGSRRGMRSRLYHHRRGRPPGDPSAVLHHLDKAVPVLGTRPVSIPPTRLWLSEQERRIGREILDVNSERGAVILHPGSKWPDKAWPISRWAELATKLSERTERQIRVVSPPGELDAARDVVGAAPQAELLPPLGLRELFGALAGAELYVGNDGGVLHAAVALQTPTLGLFGPTDPRVWFPYGDPHRVLHSCAQPTTKESDAEISRLRELDVATVLRQCEGLLSRDQS